MQIMKKWSVTEHKRAYHNSVIKKMWSIRWLPAGLLDNRVLYIK